MLVVRLYDGNFTALRHRPLYYPYRHRGGGHLFVPIDDRSVNHSVDYGDFIFV